MAKVVMRLAVMDNGTIKVEKGDMKAPKKMTKSEFKKSLVGKNMKNAESITVLQSNPCIWVNAIGSWYYICW
ncbi:hypothetical protein MNBD_NITROSPIRAE03-1886 [hydrothermal vent metagenome]|uniref:Uncharacterized protein n=1 Tax=hydrothermal vent metagenome TaxID=652676 RepID=A0A3B1CX68_9ZZZZ